MFIQFSRLYLFHGSSYSLDSPLLPFPILTLQPPIVIATIKSLLGSEVRIFISYGHEDCASMKTNNSNDVILISFKINISKMTLCAFSSKLPKSKIK